MRCRLWPGQSMPLTSRMSCQPSRVVVEKGAAGAQRLGQKLAAVGAAVVLKLNAGRGGDVDEAEPGRDAERRAAGAAQSAAELRTPTPDPPPAQEMTGGSRDVHQPVADRVDHEFGGLVDAERVHDVGAVHRDGVGAEIEHGRDLLVRLAVARSAAALRVRAASGLRCARP